MLYIAYIPDACRCILFSLYTNYDCYRWNGSAFLSINFFLDSVVILAFFSPHDFYHWKVLFIANKVVMHIYRLQNSFILFYLYFFCCWKVSDLQHNFLLFTPPSLSAVSASALQRLPGAWTAIFCIKLKEHMYTAVWTFIHSHNYWGVKFSSVQSVHQRWWMVGSGACIYGTITQMEAQIFVWTSECVYIS